MISLYEGLLDMDLGDQIDASIVGDFINKNCKGDFKLSRQKDGTYKVRGKLILSKLPGEHILPGFVISEIKGSLFIEDCPDLVSCEGLFSGWDDYITTKISGDFGITNCPKFNTLKGTPEWVDGSITLVNLPKLKSLDHISKWAHGATIMKCGKKWTKEQIQKHVTLASRIFCSEEELIANIREAFDDPILLKFWQTIINDKRSKKSMIEMTGQYAIDKIRPSDVEQFELPKDAAICKKALYEVARKGGFAIGMDFEGNFKYIANTHLEIYRFDEERTWARGNWNDIVTKKVLKRDTYKQQEWCKYCLDNAAIIYVYQLDKEFWIGDKRSGRDLAKRGVITPDKYKEIAKANREKYKRAVAQLKIAKDSDKYKDLAKKVESILIRFSKIPMKLIQDANFANTRGLTVEYAAEKVKLLMEAFGCLAYYIQLTSNKNGYSADSTAYALKKYEENVNQYYNELDEKLTYMGL